MGRSLACALALLVAGCGAGAGSARVAPLRGSPVQVPRTAPGAGSYAPWPGFAHDPAHSGSADVVGPQRLYVRWTRQLE